MHAACQALASIQAQEIPEEIGMPSPWDWQSMTACVS